MNSGVLVALPVVLRELTPGFNDGRLDFEAVDLFDFAERRHGSDGDTTSVADDHRGTRRRVMKYRQVTDHELREHVGFVRSVHFPVRAKANVILSLADGDRGVVAVLEVHDVGILVLLFDRKLGPPVERSRVDDDAAVEHIGRPEQASPHRKRRQNQ